MQTNLAHLESALPLVNTVTTELLNGALDRLSIAVVKSIEDDTVAAVADHGDKLDIAVVDVARVCRGGTGHVVVVNCGWRNEWGMDVVYGTMLCKNVVARDVKIDASKITDRQGVELVSR